MYVTVEFVSLAADAALLAAAESPRAIAMARAAAASIDAVARAAALVASVSMGTRDATTSAPIATRMRTGEVILTGVPNAAAMPASRSRSVVTQAHLDATSSSRPKTVCGEPYKVDLSGARPIGVAPARLACDQACILRTGSSARSAFCALSVRKGSSSEDRRFLLIRLDTSPRRLREVTARRALSKRARGLRSPLSAQTDREEHRSTR